jgi:hypothetical protein
MTKFTDWTKRAAPTLRSMFGFDNRDIAAIMGNGGHESAGFLKLQEIKPVVKGSRGGFGIFQWTGPRRRAYEAWCAQNGHDPTSYEANIGFLIHELKGPEKRAVSAVKNAPTLAQKVIAFEKAYERAGVKHYDSRQAWALKALAALTVYNQPPPKPVEPLPPPPDIPAPEPKEARNKDDAVIDLSPKVVITTLTGGGAVGLMSILNGISNIYGLIAFLAIFAVIGFILYKVWFKKRRNDR